VPKFIKKNEEQIQRIKARILQSFLFSGLEQRELDIVIGAMDERQFQAGETVIHQGENGDCLYVVETGELNCFKRFVRIN
jgi:cAMP-dependent protein kinase regulator